MEESKREVLKLIRQCEEELKDIYLKIDNICLENSNKVLSAFKKCHISYDHFNSSTGYGYGDIGRDKIEEVFSHIFHTESSIVRNQFISGTHALTVSLFGLLRPGDTLLTITGEPYDTLKPVIGIEDNDSSLKSYNINYRQIDLIDNDFDYESIKDVISSDNIKVVHIQRSKGYSVRKSLSNDKVSKVITFIKDINKDIIVLVDNCYCEFVTTMEPSDYNADVTVGSLIKNLGGGIAPNGAYVTGGKKYIDLIAQRLTVPSQGLEVGPSLGINKSILMGLANSPDAVRNSLKVAILTSKVMSKLGYDTEPSYDEERCDIVQNIIFNNEELLVKYVRLIQKNSLIDSFVVPEKWDMPGYKDKIIMASGSFISGSSIELSCDGPLRKPYIAYQQGSISYEYGILALIDIIENMKG